MRFFAQEQYSPQRAFVGYELFLKEQVAGSWLVPRNFAQLELAPLGQLLRASLTAIRPDTQLLSVNLDQQQFIMPVFATALGALAREHPQFALVVELTEYEQNVDREALRYAAGQFLENGVQVCLDDVGCGANTMEMVNLLDPYLMEYKFALQNITDYNERTVRALPELRQWARRAHSRYKRLTVEGVECEEVLQKVMPYRPDLIQGYYFAKPHLLAVQE